MVFVPVVWSILRRYYKRFSKRYTNSEHIVGKSLINNEIFVRINIKARNYQNEKLHLGNLHVHKNLKKFQPKNLFGKQDKTSFILLQKLFWQIF